MKHIVKRHGHSEAYESRKLYGSVYAAALAVREPTGSAELLAKEVVERVDKWLEPKHEVTSNDIRRAAASYLEALHPDAAYQYTHHRVIW